MYQAVERGHENTLTTRHKAEDNPNSQRNTSVMINVQESDLIILFAHDEKYGVEKINKFRDVEAIAHLNQLQSILVVGVIHRLANETVSIEPR
jgi:hypothetical protein